MKKPALLSLLLFTLFPLPQTAFTQAGTFFTRMIVGEKNNAAVKLPSGEFVCISASNSGGLRVTKLSSAGDVVSTEEVPSPNDSITMVPHAKLLNADEVLISGTSWFFNGAYYDKYNFVAKLNLTTHAVKMNRLLQVQNYTSGPGITFSSDAIYVSYPNFYNYELAKFDLNLDPVWMRKGECDTLNYKNPGMDCECIRDTGIIIVGKGNSRIGIGEFNSSGGLSHFYKYEGSGYKRIYSITEMSDGNLLMSGVYSPVYAGQQECPLLIKMTPEGNAIWSKRLDDAITPRTFERFVDAIELSNGNIVGFTSKIDWQETTSADGVCIFDSNGNLLSAYELGDANHKFALYDFATDGTSLLMSGTYFEMPGGENLKGTMIYTDESMTGVCWVTAVTPVVSNDTMPIPTDLSGADIHLSFGTTVASYSCGSLAAVTPGSPLLCTELTSITENEMNNFTVYPVPVHSGEFINIQLNEQSDYSMELIDVNGRIISMNEFSGSETTLSTDGISPGIYLLKISDKDNYSESMKVVIR